MKRIKFEGTQLLCFWCNISKKSCANLFITWLMNVCVRIICYFGCNILQCIIYGSSLFLFFFFFRDFRSLIHYARTCNIIPVHNCISIHLWYVRHETWTEWIRFNDLCCCCFCRSPPVFLIDRDYFWAVESPGPVSWWRWRHRKTDNHQ